MSKSEHIQGSAHLQNQNYLLSSRKPKRVNMKNDHKNPNDSHNYDDEITLYQGISKMKHIMTFNTRATHTQ